MKEVTKCSISGVAFTLDVDAFETLKTYLDTLRNTYKESEAGAEIVADIEARIAELILSAQDALRVVEKPLILNIIAQMGSPEDISEQPAEASGSGEPRIPRRLYRDTDNAALGGVCAGIAKYFDIDTTWVRLGIFLPLLLSCFTWLPCMGWLGSVAGNLFGIFALCYLVMWFAVPAPRTARQKLEMNGEKITTQSIRETTEAGNNDVDSKAKPIVAEAVSVFGRIVLLGLKIFIGLIVFVLIACACGLIVGLFAVGIIGAGGISLFDIGVTSIWIPILGIFIALIPVGLLIYIFMCLIASRKPNGKTILVVLLLWLTTLIACGCLAVRENLGEQFMQRREMSMERLMKHEDVAERDSTCVDSIILPDKQITVHATVSVGDDESK